ncbi:hypothetical protein CTA2_2212, partial [Colletotrichum tanaceti]
GTSKLLTLQLSSLSLSLSLSLPLSISQPEKSNEKGINNRLSSTGAALISSIGPNVTPRAHTRLDRVCCHGSPPVPQVVCCLCQSSSSRSKIPQSKDYMFLANGTVQVRGVRSTVRPRTGSIARQRGRLERPSMVADSLASAPLSVRSSPLR